MPTNPPAGAAADGRSGPIPSAIAAATDRGALDLRSVRRAAADCRACELWSRATQTVFGAGPRTAAIMLVGEQPGDREDRAGEPFAGPAGRVLDEALSRAGIDRVEVFLTNVVKHFRWRPAPCSKRRLHERPGRAHVTACRPWLEAEIALVRPTVVGLLGATAAQSLLGSTFRVSRDRGRPIDSDFAPVVIATIHPSAVLRASSADREERLGQLVDDLAAMATRAQIGRTSR